MPLPGPSCSCRLPSCLLPLLRRLFLLCPLQHLLEQLLLYLEPAQLFSHSHVYGCKGLLLSLKRCLDVLDFEPSHP